MLNYKKYFETNNNFYTDIGVNAGATIDYGHKIQATGNGGNVPFGSGSQNTVK